MSRDNGPARIAQRIERFRCHEQTTAITEPRPTPSRTTLIAPPPGIASKTTSHSSFLTLAIPGPRARKQPGIGSRDFYRGPADGPDRITTPLTNASWFVSSRGGSYR